MPSTKVCPNCGALADLVSYVTGSPAEPPVTVPFDTVPFDVEGHSEAGGARLVAPVDGTYLIRTAPQEVDTIAVWECGCGWQEDA